MKNKYIPGAANLSWLIDCRNSWCTHFFEIFTTSIMLSMKLVLFYGLRKFCPFLRKSVYFL